jgi:SAM-dependent methyltransferase
MRHGELPQGAPRGRVRSEYGARVSSSNSGAPVRAGDLSALDFGERRFDVINATEVIEHVRDPRAFFRKVRGLLAPGGVFLYTTGNADGLYARALGTRWPYLAPEGHLFYFSARTLSRYFAEVGLGVVDVSELEGRARRAIARADDAIAHAQLTYVGKSDPGMKGLVFRTVGALSIAPVKRLVSRVVGKGLLPIGIRRA